MKKKILSLTLAALMLTGCGKTENIHEDTTPYFYNIGFRDYGYGGTYTIWGANQQTVYLDYATMENTPLCAVPNCTHTTTSCLAAQAKDPVIVNDYIYYFVHNENMKETTDGLRFEMNSKLMKASLDNSETEVVCQFTDAIPRENDPLMVIGSKLYFIGYDPDVQLDEYGGASWGTCGGFDYLCSIDLSSGAYSNYGLICYVEDEYPAADNSSRAYMSGAYNGKIYITYSFMKEPYDPMNDPDSTPEFTFYNFEFDLETEEYSESEYPPALCAEEGVYAWLDDEGDKLHIIKDGEEHVLDYVYFANRAKILNGKLFAGSSWVELSDMTVHYYSEQRGGTAMAYYDGCYIMGLDNNSNEKLTEEELLALEK